ncbi:BTAD domain-containing putative transcriptional regulator [uncultured Streptomyces sp.]|uniref:AfsR/SARP family transcriptional regulator n=1 Tax=uncultured Streptomyces sp. TaxID=174707 RepID=UPI00260D3827|nr:BTAD domain-containing putative transcriptional regulator [uncultured Streptomyces sp.]
MLLASLLAHHGQTVPTTRLIEALWGGAPPANPMASLQAKVSQLRRALEDAEEGSRDLVMHRPPGYTLRAEKEALDAQRFRVLAAHARTLAEPRARAKALADALALWRGPAFTDFSDEPFVRAVIARLEEERLTTVEEHFEARLELGEHSLLIGELTALTTAHPLRERLRMAHMRALYQAGRSSEALESYTDLRRHLGEELGLEPSQAIDALQQAILRRDPPLREPDPPVVAEPAPGRSRNLPDAPNALLGRDEALAQGVRLVTVGRLVTITGPGGVGKTRLALATADSLSGAFPDGVWLVECGGLVAPEQAAGRWHLAPHVLATLGIQESADPSDAPSTDEARARRQLADYAAGRRMLLVLDNCEHVLDDVAELVQRLLERAPGVKVLATSREPLRVPGETVLPLRPLRLPESADPAELEKSSAVRLFVERARSADPSFALDAEAAPAVAAICRRLDGIPLALELAATRVRALGVHELLDRLDDRFRVLNSGYRGAPRRQQTLQATIEWSWSLLTPQEQTVLRRLSVHSGGCTLAAAEEVCGGGDVATDQVMDILSRLVERSLVTRSGSPAAPRYRMLESVCAYVETRLQESGEAEEVALRHAFHYTELAERAQPRLHGPEQHRWLQRLSAESANFRRVVEGQASGEATLALRLVNALVWFWLLMGRLAEARHALSTALAAAPAQSAHAVEAAAWCEGIGLLLGEIEPEQQCPAPRRDQARGELPSAGLARATWFVGHALWEVGALAAAERRVNAALNDFRALRDAWGVAAALSSRAALAMATGDLDALHDDALEARAQFTELGDAWGQLKAAQELAVHAEITAAYDKAAQLHREGLRIAESLEMWSEVSRQLSGLGRIALLSGQYAQAEELHLRSLRLAAEQGNQPAEQMAELGLALGARRQGNLESAEAHLLPWLEWNRSRGASNGLALILAELGFCAELRGDAETCLALHLDGLASALASEDPRAVALSLEGLAGGHRLAGRPARAARLLGVAEATRKRSGAPLPPAERADVDRISARLRATSGVDAYAVEFAAGLLLDHRGVAAEELRTAGEHGTAGARGAQGTPTAGSTVVRPVPVPARGRQRRGTRPPMALSPVSSTSRCGEDEEAGPGRELSA